MGTLIRLRAATRPPRLETAATPASREEHGDGDLLPIVAMLWFASLTRVGYAIWDHEVFGAETTLALFFVVLAPGLFRSSWSVVLWRRNAPDSVAPPAAPAKTAIVVPLASAHAARERRWSRSNDEPA